MPIEFIAFNYRSSLLYDAVDIYCQVWGRDKDNSLMYFRKYAGYSHFFGYIALYEGRAIGMGFGTISERGHWWHDKVAEQVGQRNRALKNAWVLTELAVLQDYRNQQIGNALHERVIQAQPFPNVLLSTQADNFHARRFYEKRGWHYLHKGFPFNKGRPPYCIMHKIVAHEH
jgi:ribosomal protein S18 acetylase RimI-like enzyme